LDLPLTVSGTVDVDVPGTYVLNYSVTNALGGVATATRTVIVQPAAPVLVGSFTLSSPGQFRLQATGVAGLSYTLQVSSNLVNWVDLTNLVASPSGLIEENLEKTNAPACFYRLRWQ
jgi:hypothetical protein